MPFLENLSHDPPRDKFQAAAYLLPADNSISDESECYVSGRFLSDVFTLFKYRQNNTERFPLVAQVTGLNLLSCQRLPFQANNFSFWWGFS